MDFFVLNLKTFVPRTWDSCVHATKVALMRQVVVTSIDEAFFQL